MNDICMTEILNIYYIQLEDWRRNFFAPRRMDGIVLFTEGEITYHFAEQELTARKGDLLFLPGNLPYSGIRHSDTVSFFVLNFRCTEPDAFEKLAAPAVFTPDNYALLHTQFSKAVATWNQQPADVHLAAKSFAYSLLSQSCKIESDGKTAAPTDAVIAYILDHLADPTLSVALLCKVFFISESQLRRNIFKATSLNPNAYILALRVNKGKKELVYTGKSIQQIAADCGFSSPYYFSRCFHESTGLSPSDYRKKYNTI
ncbi:MAG: AraC family transcriptional regulator [Clostridiales bacterium]|nr:AraC family transcriptional regulator [Clostridiales bacterium]